MLRLDEKPDAGMIQGMRTHLARVWTQTHAWNVTRDTFYNRTYPLWPAGVNRPILRPGKARSIIDHGVDQLLGSSPTVERFGDTKKVENDQVELAMQAMFHQIGLQEPSLSFKEAAKNLLLYGYTIVEDDLDSVDLALARSDKPTQDAGEDEEDFKMRERRWKHKKKAVMPFRIHAPHPNDVLLDPLQKVPRVAIKLQKRYAQDLVELTEGRKERGRGDVEVFEIRQGPFELISTLEYWTDDWHAMMVDRSAGFFGVVRGALGGNHGTLLFVEPNDWGFVPFSHAFSGFGNKHASAVFDPRMLAVGLLDHIMDDLTAKAQQASAEQNMIIEAGFMPMGSVNEDPAALEEQLSTAQIVDLQNRNNLFYLERPNLPRQLKDIGLTLDKDMEETTFTRSLSGIRDVGVNTVGQQAILNTAGHRKFIDPGEQINQLATTSATHILLWTDILDLRLEIEGHKLNRTLIKGDFTAKVSFQVVDPVLRLQEKQQALSEVQAGVMSLPTYWSISGRNNASGERKRLIQDTVYANPLVQEHFARIQAEELGLARLLEDQNITGGGVQNNTQRTILGPDGEPVSSTMGSGGGPRLREPLDARTAKPGQTGQNLAG